VEKVDFNRRMSEALAQAAALRDRVAEIAQAACGEHRWALHATWGDGRRDYRCVHCGAKRSD
jgi:hypothetical protein